MDPVFTARATANAIPIWFVTPETYPELRERLEAGARAFADAAGFEPKAGRHLLLPGGDGGLAGVLFGLEGNSEAKDQFLPGRLSGLLPDGAYRFGNAPHDARLAALAFALGSYRFTRYRKAEERKLTLDLPQSVDGGELSRIVEGVSLARDLINTPANDMGPPELEQAARALGARHGATVNVIAGDDLLTKNFPLIHAVGRAAAHAPRLIDLQWGDQNHPRVTLVGKGVCFDTGGLDIKPESGMLNMKKDMGGAATALALAHMLMAGNARICLRVLIPAVENSISAASFRPRDIYRSRKGITVEIGNTDAEGRLVLADALALADEEAPELIVDFATLTGAARVALGPRSAAILHRRRRAGGRSHARRYGGKRPAVAVAAVAALRADARIESRRHQQCRRRSGRRHHGRVVHAKIRQQRQKLAAFRYFRLDTHGESGTARRRRMPGRTRALRAAASKIFLNASSDRTRS